MSPKQYKIET